MNLSKKITFLFYWDVMEIVIRFEMVITVGESTCSKSVIAFVVRLQWTLLVREMAVIFSLSLTSAQLWKPSCYKCIKAPKWCNSDGLKKLLDNPHCVNSLGNGMKVIDIDLYVKKKKKSMHLHHLDSKKQNNILSLDVCVFIIFHNSQKNQIIKEKHWCD